MATPKQRTAFFVLWAQASRAVCRRYDLRADRHDEEREARHLYLRHVTGCESINDVKPGLQFSRLMLTLAVDAENHTEAAYWEEAIAKHWRWFMESLVRQLGEIARQPVPWEYVQGIFAHLKLPKSWQDIPEAELEKVWQMLDTHRRRVLRRDHGWLGLRDGGKFPLTFDPGASYSYGGDGKLTMETAGKAVPA